MIILLVPDHAGEGLALNGALVARGHVLLQIGIVGVRLAAPQAKTRVEPGERCCLIAAAQPQAHLHVAAGGDGALVPHAGLRADLARIDAIFLGVDDVFVKPILVVAGAAEIPEPARVRFVLGEHHLRITLEIQPGHVKLRRLDADRGIADGTQRGLEDAGLPAPGIAQHQLRDQMQRGGLRTPVPGRDLHQDVAGFGLCIFDVHVEVTVVGEYPRVEQLIFRDGGAAARIFGHQIRIGVGALRIFVKHLQIRVGGCGVKIKVLFFDILAVIALGIGESEQALLENRIPAIP